MSFLNQLKSQANSLQSQRSRQEMDLQESTANTEKACGLILAYLQDLARQLNVIEPAGPAFTLDGRSPWPPMKLVDFRVDARRQMLRSREAFDYVAMGWQVVPRSGPPVAGLVAVNFPPDLQRVEARLAMGLVRHERKEIRHPQKNTLQLVQFEYLTATRASVTATADHDKGEIAFRLLNTGGFEILRTSWPASRISQEVMDELAKRIVSQPSRFI